MEVIQVEHNEGGEEMGISWGDTLTNFNEAEANLVNALQWEITTPGADPIKILR